MSPETVAAIQRAGQAVHDAHVVLLSETSALSALVMEALRDDAFNVENDARFEQWKAMARMTQTLQTVNEQLKQVYVAAGHVAMNAGVGRSTSRRLSLAAPQERTATDVVARSVKKPRKAKKQKSLVTYADAANRASAAPSARSAVSASGLKGNAGRVLDFLLTKLRKEEFSRVTHAEIAEGSPVPIGSVGAAIDALVKVGRIGEGERGSYQLL